MKIKICGLTRQQDIDMVNEAGPDCIGFVFAKSRRRIEPEKALELKKQLKGGIMVVGVFADASISEIKDIYSRGIINVVQLHGQESSAYMEQLRKETGCRIIKAVSMRPGLTSRYFNQMPADFLLLDQGKGGTGTTFDWTLIPPMKKPFFLAGGLNAGNLQQAIKQVGPFGVDLSSGVETGGIKDREKILQAIRIVKAIDSKNNQLVRQYNMKSVRSMKHE